MKRAAMDACGTKALDLQAYDWQVRALCSHAGFVWHCCMRCRLPVQPGTRLRCTVQEPVSCRAGSTSCAPCAAVGAEPIG